MPVIFVQRITARDHAVARPAGAIAKGAANPFVLEVASCQYIGWQIGIREHHTAQSDRVDPPIAYHRLPNIG